MWTGAVDDGWGGTLGWFWAACAVATIVLVVVTKAALREREYSAVMAATGLLYLAILTAFGTDLVARRARRIVAIPNGRGRVALSACPDQSGVAPSASADRASRSSCSTPCATRVSFNQLDERTMSRIRYRKVSDESGEEVPDEHIVKGYEVSKGRYVLVDPDELEPFIPSATRTVELEEFVEQSEIDPIYYENAYYVAPDANPKPYVLLARAMEEAGKVAIGRFVMRNKQYTAAIRAIDGRLMMSTLAYADEVVQADSIDELAGLDDVDVSARRGPDGRGARRVALRRVRA